MGKKSASLKIKDTGEDTSFRSRADAYWQERGFQKFWKQWRTPDLKFGPSASGEHYSFLLDKFSLKSIEFGNWVNNEWRLNYLMAATVALYDINKVVKFNYNLGLDKTIGLSFGSRGKGSALAHFEPGTMMINLTRYSRDTIRPLNSGGVGSLAHEYGHALDYFFGSRVVGGRWSLSKGHTTDTRFDLSELGGDNGSAKDLVRMMNRVIFAIIYGDAKKNKDGVLQVEWNTYYKKLRERVTSDYWIRHNELFARAFEQYVQYKLEKLGISDKFLSKTKYESYVYLDSKAFAKVLPEMDALIAEMRKYVLKGF